jgi:hypothetical protein
MWIEGETGREKEKGERDTGTEVEEGGKGEKRREKGRNGKVKNRE